METSARRLAMWASASSIWSMRIRHSSPGWMRASAVSMARNSPLISSMAVARLEDQAQLARLDARECGVDGEELAVDLLDGGSALGA